MNEWLLRTETLLGKEKLSALESARVLVVGLGGVGSWAAEMLCRSGIGSMTIVDGDTVSASNRNRQLPALTSTEGRYKADVLGERLLDINPELKLTVVREFIRDGRMIEILDRGFDSVVDAIDTLSPKVFLIHHTVCRRIPLVSSMGSGGKVDPGQIRVSDISETVNCPLARIIRKRIHRMGIRNGFTAVWSPEKPDKSKVIAVTGEMNKASVVGTVSYMPALFGIMCASAVIRNLAGLKT
ncbi:MAG: tRNA threonylcarbamoyladenosine dehydratase [Bacteroidales bacterium]|jgi:tRNA A37 threonylcarbamoyladenosine dehydratase|nr:tRNA threonylcarbamoyladenosine dehydratase [Bacteroidales bacterium]